MGWFVPAAAGALGAAGSLFGGDKTSRQKLNKYDNWNSEQKQLFQSLAGIVRGGMTGPGPTAPQMFTPQTDEEGTYLNWAKSQALQNMASGTPAYDISPEATDEYFQNVMAPEIEQNVQSAYAGPGYWGTKRMEAESQQKSQAHSALKYQDELARRQALENAQSRMIPAGEAMRTAGEYSRMIAEQETMDLVNRYFMGEEVNGQRNQAYNPMMNWAYNLLGLKPFNYGSSTNTDSGSTLGAMAGGASSALLQWLMNQN